MANYGLNRVFLRRMIRLLTSMMGGTQTKAVLFFMLLLFFAVGYEVSGYFAGLVSSRFFKVLVGRDLPGFRKVAWTGVLTVLATAAIKSGKTYVAKILSLEWRKNLVAALHSFYFREVSFFRANVASSLDNPDQRQTQDVERLCTAASLIVVPIILSPFKIGWYSYQAYSTSDWYAPVGIYLFFLLSMIFNRFLVSRVSSWVFRQEEAEGGFRFAHTSVRTQCESIAFYRAGVVERRKADSVFSVLFAVQRSLFSWQLALDIACLTFDYVAAILSYLLIAVPIFNGTYDNLDPDDLSAIISKNGFVCIMLMSSFSDLVDISSKIGDVAGNAHRVGEFLEYLTLQHLRDNDKNNNGNNHDYGHGGNSPAGCRGRFRFRSTATGSSILDPTVQPDNNGVVVPNADDPDDDDDDDDEVNAFVLENFTCFTPPDAQTVDDPRLAMISTEPNIDGSHSISGRRLLVKSLYLGLTRGNDVLITGPSGVGKSSLLRTIFGLWPLEGGSSSLTWSVDFLDPKRVMVLPQSPYVFDDPNSTSIISELAVPPSFRGPSDGALEPVVLDEIRAAEALTAVGLSHLLRRERSGSWRDTLSRGEKQKLGFARLMYHRPSFAILDEATSSLDQESEAMLYGLVKSGFRRGVVSVGGDEEEVTTILSVGHRHSVRKFHRMELSLKGKGEWSFDEIRNGE